MSNIKIYQQLKRYCLIGLISVALIALINNGCVSAPKPEPTHEEMADYVETYIEVYGVDTESIK